MDCTTPQAALVAALGILVGIFFVLVALIALTHTIYRAAITFTRNEVKLVPKERAPKAEGGGQGMSRVATWLMVMAILAVIIIPTTMLITRG